MKEFEKYFKECFKPNDYCVMDGKEFRETSIGFPVYISLKQGWKAALEMVKSKIDYANAGNDMIDWIFEEELDATSKERYWCCFCFSRKRFTGK